MRASVTSLPLLVVVIPARAKASAASISNWYLGVFAIGIPFFLFVVLFTG
jgi:hypothetical protein